MFIAVMLGESYLSNSYLTNNYFKTTQTNVIFYNFKMTIKKIESRVYLSLGKAQ